MAIHFEHMQQKRIDDHTILLVDDVPRIGYSQAIDLLRKVPEPLEVSTVTACCTSGEIQSNTKPVDRGYYRRTFGHRR